MLVIFYIHTYYLHITTIITEVLTKKKKNLLPFRIQKFNVVNVFVFKNFVHLTPQSFTKSIGTVQMIEICVYQFQTRSQDSNEEFTNDKI